MLSPPSSSRLVVDTMPTSPQRNSSGVSPSSSPRLPSPPPFTEVQFGPKSPSISGAVTEFSLDASKLDDDASRRIRPGSKAAEMAKGPPYVPLHQLESPFQLQEYLSALYHKLTRDETSKTVKPVDKEAAIELATPPTAQDTGETVDRNLWLYELCRFLCNKTSRIIVAFFADNPPCSSQTCPEMRASEWQYLCAVHEPPKSCCAIDYCNHTLDWASNVLTSNKHFPSRLNLGGDTGNAYQSMRQLTNIFRRVYRIYAHAWFQHREVFWSIESELGLYMFFKTVCDQYQLIPEDNYTIPPEAEGEREEKEEPAVLTTSPEKSNISILRKESDQPDPPEPQPISSSVSTGATTRRHKHTPSTGVPVAVIAEGTEEEEEETTIIDTGDSIPVQASPASLSPPKRSIERAKSPGSIEIPANTEPERAPEDPTPVAHHETNPFGSPGPAEVTESLPTEPQTAIPLDISTVNDTEKTVDEEAKGAIPAEWAPSTSMTTDVLGAVLEHLQATDNPKAFDSDTETQIAIEDVEPLKSAEEDDEKMEVIDVEQIHRATAEEASKTANDPEESETKQAEQAEKSEST